MNPKIRVNVKYEITVLICIIRVRVRVMVFNATFNNISAISWWSILSLKETGVPVENHKPAVSH